MTDAAARRRTVAVAVVVAAVVVVIGAVGIGDSVGFGGCRRSNRTPDRGSAVARPVVVIDVAGVNALVPAALKDRLVFERRALTTERGSHKTSYALAVPSGWVQTNKLFAHLRPASATAQAPRLEVGANCDGPCTPKPWEAIVDRVNFAPLAKGKVIKDEHVAGRRTMIAEVGDDGGGGSTARVVVAWWNDDERNYHVCSAMLDDEFKEAASAFEKACQAVVISGDD